MSNEVIEAIRRVIPFRTKRSGRGWITFNCPACGDDRGRAGYLETPTGGFRYRCFNGGCTFEDAAGWEPGGPFIGRARQVLLDLGGDLTEIAPEILSGRTKIVLSREDWFAYMMSDESAVMSAEPRTATHFPEIELPSNTVVLWETNDPRADKVKQYMQDRSAVFKRCDYPVCWSPRYALYAIIPFMHRHKIVGWIGRRVVKDHHIRHLKCPDFPTDYMLNQENIHGFPTVLVMESAFDAWALHGVCTFGNTLSEKQINLLNECGKKIVLVPDYKGDEWRSYWRTAKENGWHLAIPEWGGNYGSVDHIKDPGEAIHSWGVLHTLHKIINSTTDNYMDAEIFLMGHSRG